MIDVAGSSYLIHSRLVGAKGLLNELNSEVRPLNKDFIAHYATLYLLHLKYLVYQTKAACLFIFFVQSERDTKSQWATEANTQTQNIYQRMFEQEKYLHTLIPKANCELAETILRDPNVINGYTFMVQAYNGLNINRGALSTTKKSCDSWTVGEQVKNGCHFNIRLSKFPPVQSLTGANVFDQHGFSFEAVINQPEMKYLAPKHGAPAISAADGSNWVMVNATLDGYFMLWSMADTGTGRGEWLKREGDGLVPTATNTPGDTSFYFLVTRYGGVSYDPEKRTPEELAWEKAHGWP
jgi:hypothetical protein